MRVIETEEGFYLETLEGRVAISEAAFLELKPSLREPAHASTTCHLCGGTGLRCVGDWTWGKGYDVCGCRQTEKVLAG